MLEIQDLLLPVTVFLPRLDDTGVCMDLLCPMTKVALFLLMEGHTFPNKDILLMGIAKETKILGVQVGEKGVTNFSLL